MDMIPGSLLTIMELLSSTPGLIFQSALIIFLSLGSISLINSARRQIHKKDILHARVAFIAVILLNLLLISLYFVQISNALEIPSPFSDALQQLVWSYNLILIGWLWIKPSHQSQFPIFKKIFLCTAAGIFVLETFQLIEMLFSPVAISIPYAMIWKVFEFIVGIFLFFVYLSHSGKMQSASLLFALLQILGLGADRIFTVSPLFSQGFSQILAFLLSSQIFLALSLDYSEMEKNSGRSPVILSENLAAIPNSTIIRGWLQANLESDRSILPFSLCKALAQTFCSDACLIIQVAKSKTEIKIICGYSLKHHKPLVQRVILADEEIVTQKKSVLFHDSEEFPAWIKMLIKKIQHSHAKSVWYIPLESMRQKYFLIFLSQELQWTNDHIAYFKKILPDLVQILHIYFGEDRMLLPEKQPAAASSNPFMELMHSEINYKKDIHQVESELQLALEEYNRIRKILEERGIGQ